jgi:sulfatase modifying factor 1
MNRRAATLVLGLSCLVVASCREKVSLSPTATSDEPSAPIPTARDQLAAVAKAPARGDGSCPDGMALVEGEYCPNVQLNCKRYLDPKGRYEHFRCADYGPSTCKSKARRHLRYCIDRTEYVPPGETLPANHKSFTHAEQTCKSLGKRVCMESEWNFACEGEEMRPYPYGFSRDTEACNADRLDIVTDTGTLRDLRAPPAVRRVRSLGQRRRVRRHRRHRSGPSGDEGRVLAAQP